MKLKIRKQFRKSWNKKVVIFESVKVIKLYPARLTKKKKGKRYKQKNIKHTGIKALTVDHMAIKSIIRECYEQLYANLLS